MTGSREDSVGRCARARTPKSGGGGAVRVAHARAGELKWQRGLTGGALAIRVWWRGRAGGMGQVELGQIGEQAGRERELSGSEQNRPTKILEIRNDLGIKYKLKIQMSSN